MTAVSGICGVEKEVDNVNHKVALVPKIIEKQLSNQQKEEFSSA